MRVKSYIRGEKNIYYIPTLDTKREVYPTPFDYQMHLIDDRLRFTMKGDIKRLEVDFDEAGEVFEEWQLTKQDIEFELYRDEIGGYSIKMFPNDACFELLVLGRSGADLLNMTFKLRRDAKKMREIIHSWKVSL